MRRCLRCGWIGAIALLALVACTVVEVTPGAVTPSQEPEPAATRQLRGPDAAPSATPQVVETPVPAVQAVRITILYDNTIADASLQAGWGFAAYVEVGEHVLLFDTGADGQALLSNASELGIDLQAVEAIVLSHSHADHTDGLQALFDAGIAPPVYGLSRFPSDLKSRIRRHAELVELDEPTEIFPGVHSTGALGASIPEQALVLETPAGPVIVTGCAHPGIVRMVQQAADMLGSDHIALVLGGFHLVNTTSRRVQAIIDDFRELGVEQVSATHCTGDDAIAAFAEAYGDDALPAGVGRVFEFGGATTPTPAVTDDPMALISQDSMFAFMEALTAIQPYSGWRNSGSEGEAEALDYVAGRLDGFAYLRSLGLELERQQFNVFMATELWETRLYLTVDGAEVEVPADGLRGPRDELAQALRFDSDGAFNDDDRNPVEVARPAVWLRYVEELEDLGGAAQDAVVLLDYAAIDRALMDTEDAVAAVERVLAAHPAALVLVTQFSNALGESHGFAIGDLSALNWATTEPPVPVLYVRMEDLVPAGIADWRDFERIDAARLIWDADVFQPGTSGNLVAHIPGKDPAHALILGGHIDSPNCPGAMDDGSGSVILLEIARVLEAARVQPPVDLYLAWFGSEEIGLYGGAHFALTHQELLDRALAMLQIDDLTHPLDGIDARLDMVSWTYAGFGDESLAWPEYLGQVAGQQDIAVEFYHYAHPYSDNTSFGGFDVPNADLIYEDPLAMQATGSFHYAAHIHDPYDTVELAREVGDVLEQMAQVVLLAVLNTDAEHANFRVTPAPDRRAVFVAGHTEALHDTPAALVDVGMALSWAGFDVDVLPYGQPLTQGDVAGAALVVVLPPHDYPADEAFAAYDEAWPSAEVDVLEAYVADGGFLVLANAASRLKFGAPLEFNEDWDALNVVSARFGVTYGDGDVDTTVASVRGHHALVQDAPVLFGVHEHGLFFTMETGDVLAESDGLPVAGLVEYGDGEVLVLADLGFLATGQEGMDNGVFWANMAEYARGR